MKKNLVMGTGRGYSWYTFEPFVRSFLKYRADNSELVLFVDDISEFTRDRLNQQGGVSFLSLSLKLQNLQCLSMYVGKFF